MNTSLRSPDAYRSPGGFDSFGGTVGRPLGHVNSGGFGARDVLQAQHLVDQLNGRVARDPSSFRQASELAFGSKADHASVNALIDAARTDRLPVPSIRFVEPGALGGGAVGAYAADGGGTIWLDRSLMGNPAELDAVFTEEWGHHVDVLLGGTDPRGDEGQIFSIALLDGGSPPADRLAAMRGENDHGSLVSGGRLVQVEHSLGSDTPGGSPEGIGGDESGIGNSNDNEDHNDGDTGRTPPARTSRTAIEVPPRPAAPEPVPRRTGPAVVSLTLQPRVGPQFQGAIDATNPTRPTFAGTFGYAQPVGPIANAGLGVQAEGSVVVGTDPSSGQTTYDVSVDTVGMKAEVSVPYASAAGSVEYDTRRQEFGVDSQVCLDTPARTTTSARGSVEAKGGFCVTDENAKTAMEPVPYQTAPNPAPGRTALEIMGRGFSRTSP